MRPGSGLGDGAWVLSIDWWCAGESIRPIALGYESRTSARGWGPPGGPRQPRHTHQPGDAAGGCPSPPKVCVLRCSLGQSEERGYKSNRCGGGRQRTSRRRPTEPSKARVVQIQPLEEAAATAPWHRQAGPGGAPFWINQSDEQISSRPQILRFGEGAVVSVAGGAPMLPIPSTAPSCAPCRHVVHLTGWSRPDRSDLVEAGRLVWDFWSSIDDRFRQTLPRSIITRRRFCVRRVPPHQIHPDTHTCLSPQSRPINTRSTIIDRIDSHAHTIDRRPRWIEREAPTQLTLLNPHPTHTGGAPARAEQRPWRGGTRPTRPPPS